MFGLYVLPRFGKSTRCVFLRGWKNCNQPWLDLTTSKLILWERKRRQELHPDDLLCRTIISGRFNSRWYKCVSCLIVVGLYSAVLDLGAVNWPQLFLKLVQHQSNQTDQPSQVLFEDRLEVGGTEPDQVVDLQRWVDAGGFRGGFKGGFREGFREGLGKRSGGKQSMLWIRISRKIRIKLRMGRTCKRDTPR